MVGRPASGATPWVVVQCSHASKVTARSAAAAVVRWRRARRPSTFSAGGRRGGATDIEARLVGPRAAPRSCRGVRGRGRRAPYRRAIDRHEQFPPRTASVRAARRLAADVLRESPYRGDAEAVLLMVSELVTNAVLHARTEFELHLRVEEAAVVVAVVDHDRTHPPRLEHPGPRETHGRGLQIVDRLSSSWGSEPVGADGKRVWFQCRVEPAAAAVSAGRGVRRGPAVPAARPSAGPPRR
jgi:anti-sigma regulatory factor (Ser/Thr protein kinase)